ncbi:nucleoside triphosphate pyrophosphohydrolase [Pseudaeromonas sharmana]|uniref:Nucleoside triphosphate pyrophosphohydrolase n=1 Tax=Pseudaeromonas sharmana TaxID=328412 RepID=A0ABV8CM34_9GAMM
MSTPHYSLPDLLALMQQLRDPQRGCPWDRKQTFASIVPYTLEEAYEVADSIEREDWQALKGELGDLLFQVVFYCQMAQEKAWFNFDDVVDTVSEKLVRRHPHVFAEAKFADTAAVNANWEAEKSRERQQKDALATSVLDDIPLALPALTRANKIQKRCAGVGFDWPELQPVLDKVLEEVDEVMHEVNQPVRDEQKVAEELGDLLFATVNLVRHLKKEPEQVLRDANSKFERRFRAVEQDLLRMGLSVQQASLEQMESAWQRVKDSE